MNKDIQIWQKIKHFFDIFDKRSYETFKTVVSWIISMRNWKQADVANFWEKTLWQIQYFFAKSKWSFQLLNNLRIVRIRNKIRGAWDKKSDILVLDSTITAKSKNAKFSWLTNYFFSNKDKKVVNWFDIYWASIITKNGLKYFLDICLYFKKKKEKLSSQNKRNPSIQNELWMKFLTKLLLKTKSWLIVLDSWFRWWRIMKWIHKICKRHFLVKIGQEQYFYDNNNNCFKIKTLLKNDNCILINSSKLWIFKNVKLKSWVKKGIELKTNIIVFQKKGFKNPSILCTSADVIDIYENMLREIWDISWNDKLKKEFGENTILKIEEESKIYYAFALLYERRWSIEQCFKELKTYLWFENFQVQTYDSIMKYMHIVILVHTLLYITLSYIYQDHIAKNLIYEYLKTKRNIKNNNNDIYFTGLKLFIEMITLKPDDFKPFYHLKLFNFSISLKSCFSLNNHLNLS